MKKMKLEMRNKRKKKREAVTPRGSEGGEEKEEARER